MKLARTDLPARTEREAFLHSFDLSGKLGSATISAVEMLCEPTGLTIGTPVFGGKSLVVRISGGDAGNTYIISAKCTLSDGTIIEPWVKQRIIEAGQF